MTHVGDGAGRIVGQRMDEDRYAPRAVSLVGDLDVVHTFEVPRALLDGALDVLLRHRRRLCRVDRGAEPRITGGIASTDLRRHRDLANELREVRPALRVGRGLVVLDLLPFAVTSHDMPC